MTRELGKIKYCNAGHTPPLISSNGKNYKFLTSHKDTVVGILPAKEKDYFTEELEFEAGNRMFLYSDGVTEAINSKKKPFTPERLNNILNDTNSIEVDKIIKVVDSALEKYTETEEQADDITMMTIENRGQN